MKIWNKAMYPLLIALILLGFTALRIAVPAIPYDSRFLLYFRFILRIFSEEWFGSDWVLWDLLLLIPAILCTMAVPFLRKLGNVKRLVICTLLTLTIFVVCTPMVNGVIAHAQAEYKALQDRQYDEMVDAHQQEIRGFIEIADEAIWYSNTAYMSDQLRTAFPELLASEIWSDNSTHTYITDTMMIDYDSMTIGFAYYDITMFKLRTFAFAEGQPPESSTWSHSVDLSQPGAKLTMYFDYRDGKTGNGSTMTCIALTMEDGSMYTAVDITNPETGYNYYVGQPSGGAYERIEDFLERKEND